MIEVTLSTRGLDPKGLKTAESNKHRTETSAMDPVIKPRDDRLR